MAVSAVVSVHVVIAEDNGTKYIRVIYTCFRGREHSGWVGKVLVGLALLAGSLENRGTTSTRW